MTMSIAVLFTMLSCCAAPVQGCTIPGHWKMAVGEGIELFGIVSSMALPLSIYWRKNVKNAKDEIVEHVRYEYRTRFNYRPYEDYRRASSTLKSDCKQKASEIAEDYLECCDLFKDDYTYTEVQSSSPVSHSSPWYECMKELSVGAAYLYEISASIVSLSRCTTMILPEVLLEGRKEACPCCTIYTNCTLLFLYLYILILYLGGAETTGVEEPQEDFYVVVFVLVGSLLLNWAKQAKWAFDPSHFADGIPESILQKSYRLDLPIYSIYYALQLGEDEIEEIEYARRHYKMALRVIVDIPEIIVALLDMHFSGITVINFGSLFVSLALWVYFTYDYFKIIRSRGQPKTPAATVVPFGWGRKDPVGLPVTLKAP